MAGSIGRYGGHQLLAELPNVLRFGAAVGNDGHLLVHLSGSLETELALLLAGHVRIAGIGEFGTGGLWECLSRQQKYNYARSQCCNRPIHLRSVRPDSVVRHSINLS